MNILLQSSLFILTLQDYPLLTNSFYLELIHFQENVPLHFSAQKCDLNH